MANKEHTAKERIEKVNKKEKKLITEESMMILVIIILVISLIIFLYPNFKNREKAKTYSVEIIKIQAENCEGCFDSDLISQILLQSPNIAVKEEKTLNYDSEEAKKIIKKYNIKRIPALIVSSKSVDKLGLSENLFRKDKNVAIFDKAVPYLDIDTRKINGLVYIIEIYDRKCEKCASLSQIQTTLKRLEIKIKNYEMIDYSSEKGKELINKNNIKIVPALLISKEIKEYWWIFDEIGKSFIEKEEYYALKEQMPPYKEIPIGEIKGLVKFTYIINGSCSDCLNITTLKDAFQKSGIYVDSEKYTDIGSIEGKNLISRYNITLIPTVVLSKEISDYQQIKSMLRQIGTFESDGNFVFRKVDTFNEKYQEL